MGEGGRDAVGVNVSAGVGVSDGGRVAVGVDAMVAVIVALRSGAGVSVVCGVAVMTIITGEGQLHCKSVSGVSVGMGVTVAVWEAVGVMLGVRVGVFVFNSTSVGSSGLPLSAMKIEGASMKRNSSALLTSANVKGDRRSCRRR